MMEHVHAIEKRSISSLERGSFIRKVYAHLFLAICGFVGLEYIWFSTNVAFRVFEFVAQVNWLIVLAIFMLISWLATRLANSLKSRALQYAGLSLYVFIESLIFIPMLVITQYYSGGGAIEKAGYITIGAFLALTATVFYTKIDLIGWGKYLAWAGILALTTIIVSAIFGFELGTFFSLAMVGFAGIAILYDTSKILHHYDDESYVVASLELFASVTLLFWYLLRLSDRD